MSELQWNKRFVVENSSLHDFCHSRISDLSMNCGLIFFTDIVVEYTQTILNEYLQVLLKADNVLLS